MQELIDALRTGVSLDELWKVARGEVKYADFLQGRQGRAPSGSPPPREAPRVPKELVSRRSNPVYRVAITHITCPREAHRVGGRSSEAQQSRALKLALARSLLIGTALSGAIVSDCLYRLAFRRTSSGRRRASQTGRTSPTTPAGRCRTSWTRAPPSSTWRSL